MNRWLPLFSVTRPVTVVMAFVAVCVLGVLAWQRVPLDMLPPGFNAPYIWVWVPYRDTTPLETEERIVHPMEEQLATVAGIKNLSARAQSSGGQVEIEFHQEVDMGQAYNQVVDRMERAMAELPDDVERYWVFRWNPADEPKLWLGFTVPDRLEDPYPVVVQRIQRPLERIEGVGQIEVWGVDEKSVWVDFDREALAAHGVDLSSLIQRLRGDNFQLSGGRITERGALRYLRSLARFDDLDTLRDYPIRAGLKLSDVATISYRAEPDDTIHHINGQDAAVLGVQAESGANTVELCRRVHEVLAELQRDPALEGFTFFTIFDQGEQIEKSIGTLRDTALQGGFFALIVLFLFLREWRMTLLIAGCIPFSLLITVGVLYFSGGNLNLLSMAGMMIAVGMVVDNAIVVVETIFKARQGGQGRRTAAIGGTAEVAMAITMSTATTMVVFLPIILMSENAMFSFFMKALGLPVVWALGASLVVALVFTPLTTTFLERKRIVADARWLVWLTNRYERTLRWVLRRRFDTLLGVVAVIVITLQVPFKAVGCSGDDEGEVSRFMLRYDLPAAMTQTERAATVQALEDLATENWERWGVEFTRARLREGSTGGWLQVSLFDKDEWPEGAIKRIEIVKDVEKQLPDLPGVRIQIGWGDDPMGNRTIGIRLFGEETEVLQGLADEVARRLEAQPAFLSAYASEDTEGSQEIQLNVDRDALARYGLDASSVGGSLAFAMRGIQLPEMWDNGRDVAVRARFQEEDRDDLDTLLDFPLFTRSGASVPIRAVTEPQVTRGWGSIRREKRRTGLTVQVDLAEGVDTMAAFGLAEQVIKEIDFPRGYGWEQGSQLIEQQESDDAQQFALLLSVVLVFLLMGILFESFVLPLSVITTVPMALLGVYWTLYFTGTPLDVMGGIGLVVLIGVVVNNGIVLVDLVTRLRGEGLERTEALVQAGRRRLRPILMTAMTTFFGLLPMAVGKSTFLDIPYAPLGRVVAGGLATATVLTLFFVPLLYTLLDDGRAAAWRLLAFSRDRPVSPENAP
ncbi:MAG: efflux RND transporter permease subunit [Pseudomonadota bacterium]